MNITQLFSLPMRLSARGAPYFNWRGLIALLSPRHMWRHVLAAFVASLIAATLLVWLGRTPRWAGVLLILIGMLPVGIAKWRADARVFGPVLMVLGALITVQGLHTVEHVIQWVQYHVLSWTARESVGLLSPANAEVVHFIWNWGVFLTALWLTRRGARNIWLWLLLAVTALHAVEHTYTFVRYLQVLSDLRELGVTTIPAQGLPGIIGRDGWLARSPLTQGTLLCSLPGLTTAIRLDVHFYWNALEVVLLVPGAARYVSGTAADEQPIGDWS
jgi:hypothetical protein